MRVYLDTVGCRLNQAEIEAMASQFRAAGHEIVPAAEGADLAVVNTCSVTAEAAADSRSMLRRLARRGVGELVATGCWATLRPAGAAALPQVRRVVPNSSKDQLVAQVLGKTAATPGKRTARMPLPGLRRRTRAFIKVQDGCDNRCTFCVTTIARGTGRSRPTTEVVADVLGAVRGGAKEIVLSGVHLGSWGRDLGLHLRDLIDALLGETEARRVRLSSLEPWDLDTSFFERWADRRLCGHFHLPLQSGCDQTLRRMGRPTTRESFRTLVAAAREVVPQAAITTDLIAGFPGETEQEFSASLDFVREMEFAGGHVFTYSPMSGTAAARMPAQVPMDERRRRNRLLREALAQSARQYRRRHVGANRDVLWESARRGGRGKWMLSGLTHDYLRVRATADGPRWNQIDTVVLREATENELLGVIVKSG